MNIKQTGWFIYIAGTFASAVEAEEVVSSVSPVAGTQIVQVILGLLLVLFVIMVLAWLSRNVFRVQPMLNGNLRILGGLSMGSRERIVLLEVGETQLLVGVSPGRVQTLHVLDKPIDTNSADKAPILPFSQLLSRINRQHTKASKQ